MTTYLRLLFTAALCCLGMTAATAQTVIEDFEGDLTLSFNDGRGDGDFSVVENPDSSSRNPSDMVGQYVKDSTAGFSLLIADLPAGTTINGDNNQLFMDIRASEDTRVIGKIEGDGFGVEQTVNIPVANQWRRYRFDLSDIGDGSEALRLVIFFDAGNETGKGTYFFDNIALGSDDCAGTERDMTIVDDFECQRQTPLRNDAGLEIVENPDPDDVNGPGLVGEYTDPAGGFSALVYDFDQPLDLEARPVVAFKYWSPIANNITVKLEGEVGGTGARLPEIGVDITEEETVEWQEVRIDFSEVRGRDFTTLTFFANFAQEGEGLVYYFDDIRFEEAEPVEFLLDFEGDPDDFALFVQPLTGAQNGSFEVVDNPDQSGENESDRVGQYTTGDAAQSTLTAASADAIDLSENSQLNMLVWAPDGSTTVRASAISTDGSRQDVTRDILATERWVEVSFNFSELADNDDVSELQFIFDGGTAEAGRVYYIDNLIFGASTVDPCEGVEPVNNLLDDFECQRNATLVNGADDIDIIPNPDMTGNGSMTVAEYTRPAGAGSEFANISYEFEDGLDLSVFNRVQFQLWAPSEVPIVVKFEDSANGAENVETEPFLVTETDSWQTYTAELSAAAGGEFRRLIIFINFNMAPATEEVFYLDNIRLVRGPVSGCVFDFETANSTPTEVNPFQGGDVNDEAFAVIENPDKSETNPSTRVGQFTEGTGGATFAGLAFPLGAPITFPDGNQTIRVKVWAPDTAVFVLKMEGGVDDANTGDVFPVEPYTTPGEWQELTYDYSNFDAEAAQYTRITIIPGFGFVPSETRQIYFDDIVIGDGMCNTSSSTRAPRVNVAQLEAFPNPATDQLTVTLPEGAAQVLVYDGLGRQVMTHREAIAGFGGTVATLDVSALATGLHVVIARDARGSVLGQVRVNVAGR